MNRNVKIAKELIRIAKSLIASDDNAIKREIEKELNTVKDEDIKNEIENMINGSVKTASDWKEKVKKIIKWCKGHVVSIPVATLIITLVLAKAGYGNETVYQAFGTDPTDIIAGLAKEFAMLGASGALLTAILEKICEKCGIRKQESVGIIEQILGLSKNPLIK